MIHCRRNSAEFELIDETVLNSDIESKPTLIDDLMKIYDPDGVVSKSRMEKTESEGGSFHYESDESDVDEGSPKLFT